MRKRNMLPPPAQPVRLEIQAETKSIVEEEFDIPGEQTPEQKERIKKSVSHKLISLIENPEIRTIECPGPSKSLVINKSGSLQPERTFLSPEEIDYFIKSFSEESGTEIHNDILKAKIGKISITAIISEYLGSRFILQKG